MAGLRAAGNFAYYAGGITTVTVNTLYRYDFAANTWATMAPLQTARTSEELMTSPDGCKLYAVMGGDATFFTGVPLPVSVEIYDIAANSWTYGNPVVTKAAAPSGGLAGGTAASRWCKAGWIARPIMTSFRSRRLTARAGRRRLRLHQLRQEAPAAHQGR